MKTRLLSATAVALLTALVALIGAAVTFNLEATEKTASQPLDAKAEQIERGRYLVTLTGCNDCHTPFKMGANGPEPDMSRMLSGHPAEAVFPPPPAAAEGSPWLVAGAATNTAWAGPWGIAYTTNLTPDETGMGDWSEEEFIAAMRSGRHRGRGRQILPPMPWPGYAQAKSEDLAAIYAYLRSIPPIQNQVPEAVLAPAPAH